MLLAGGQGSRLTVLTEETAKPAVPFGGKYRIIDFPLSNCVNSGIDTVGIMTQYQPLELNEYIGNGAPWGLNSNNGGIHVLSPYSKSRSSEWYKGTANAIYQNIAFIERYRPSHVLILSGDHIYRMRYNRMLRRHIQEGADCTIAVFNVPLEEASRFGIMNADENGVIQSFEEKPKKPKSTLASMGIYIFKWEVLREYLEKDSLDPNSSNDFGKDIIPALLRDRHRLIAYPFSGYWKDVGTIDSLWSANMDLLGEKPELDLKSGEMRIYARNFAKPSSFISSQAVVENSYIAEGSTVHGKVYNSIISTGCVIEADAEVHDSVVMPDVVIEKRAVIRHAIIGQESVIHQNARVGDSPDFYPKSAWGIAVVGKGREIEQNGVISPKQHY